MMDELEDFRSKKVKLAEVMERQALKEKDLVAREKACAERVARLEREVSNAQREAQAARERVAVLEKQASGLRADFDRQKRELSEACMRVSVVESQASDFKSQLEREKVECRLNADIRVKAMEKSCEERLAAEEVAHKNMVEALKEGMDALRSECEEATEQNQRLVLLLDEADMNIASQLMNGYEYGLQFLEEKLVTRFCEGDESRASWRKEFAMFVGKKMLEKAAGGASGPVEPALVEDLEGAGDVVANEAVGIVPAEAAELGSERAMEPVGDSSTATRASAAEVSVAEVGVAGTVTGAGIAEASVVETVARGAAP